MNWMANQGLSLVDDTLGREAVRSTMVDQHLHLMFVNDQVGAQPPSSAKSIDPLSRTQMKRSAVYVIRRVGAGQCWR